MKQFLVLLLCIPFAATYGQNRTLDSLNAKLVKTNVDTARINLMNRIASSLRSSNLDSSIGFATKTIAIAKAKRYASGEAEAHRQLAAGLIFKNRLTEADSHLKTALELYQSVSDVEGIAKTYGTYGVYYGVQSKHDSSTFYIKKELQYERYIRDKSLVSSAYQNVALNYFMQSDFLQALSYQQKAMDIADALHDDDTKAYIFLNMALVYDEMNDSVRMEQNLQKAVRAANKSGNATVEQYAYSNLASLYYQNKSYERSYGAAMKAYDMRKTTGDIGIAASSLSRAARALTEQNRFEESEKMSSTAIALADSAGVPINKFQTLATAAYIRQKQKQYAKAISFYEQAFAALKDADIYTKEIGATYNDLSGCYEATGNYQKALASFKVASQVKDSLANRDNIRKATERNMNYEFSKKQQQAKAEQDKLDAIAKSKQTVLIIGLVFTLLIIAAIVYAYRNKQKANNLLQLQKKQIETTLNELKTTQAQLIQSEKMASLGELTAGIAHEIQNPLNFVNNFSELNAEMIDELKIELENNNIVEAIAIADDIKSNEEKIVHHGRRADAIVKGMLQHSRQTGGQKELTDVNTLCDEYLRLSYHGLRAKDKSFNCHLSTEFDKSPGKINIVPQDIGRVLLNIFNNAFYAVNEKKKSCELLDMHYEPAVSVQTKKINNKTKIIIADSGNGIPQSVMTKIFQPFFTTKPTGEGTGLGLSLSYDVITKEHKGTLQVESEEGKGTCFIITLPQ